MKSIGLRPLIGAKQALTGSVFVGPGCDKDADPAADCMFCRWELEEAILCIIFDDVKGVDMDTIPFGVHMGFYGGSTSALIR